MEWLILRLHRLHVEKFGPITTDLSNWIRLYRELLKPDKEFRRQKQEARVVKERLAKFDEAIAEQKAALQKILREMEGGD